MSATPTRNLSPWTKREKLLRVMWGLTYCLVFRLSPHPFYALRSSLLRLFGARVGRNVRIRPSVRITIPWNLALGDDVSVGDYAILYALGPIRIGCGTFVSQYAHLCAGTHDYSSLDYPLLRPPIDVGQNCWIAADAFIGPGTTVGDGAVIAARATVVKDVPPGEVWGGSPARFIKQRKLDEA